MQHTTFNWYASDGQKVFGQVWRPEVGTAIRAVICLVHGLGEHSGRYAHMAKFFVGKDYAVVAFDLRGHGNSDGKRGAIPNYDLLLQQVDRGLEECSKRFPGERKFLYGHSLGGNIVTVHTLTRNPRILGSIVSAPWLRLVQEVPKSKIMQARIANYVWGGYTEKNGLDVNHLSKDPNVVQAYVDDPLVHNKISARLFLYATTWGEQALVDAHHLGIKMLLMHGTADQMTSHDASAFFAKEAPDFVTFKSWQGLYHELHNEPEKMQVFNTALNWMEDRLMAVTQIS